RQLLRSGWAFAPGDAGGGADPPDLRGRSRAAPPLRRADARRPRRTAASPPRRGGTVGAAAGRARLARRPPPALVRPAAALVPRPDGTRQVRLSDGGRLPPDRRARRSGPRGCARRDRAAARGAADHVP